MEEGFKVRLDKTFGFLTTSSSPSSASRRSLWCLADNEIDSNQLSIEKELSGPRPSLFDSVRQGNDLVALEADDNGGGDQGLEEEQRSSRPQKPDDYSDEWEIIKSTIGMDCTLEMEEEEDEIDKVALGQEIRGDPSYLYMKDVNDYETEADDWDELPGSFKDVERDPRANHTAAKLRLKEDAEAVKQMNSLHVSEVDDSFMYKEVLGTFDNEETRIGYSEDCGLKPILKRKDNPPDYKLQKRVRFSSDIRDADGNGGESCDNDSVMEIYSQNEYTVQPDFHKGIPDYMRNPLKYTRYTFESSEVDEESNRKAYVDFLNMVRSQRNSQDEDTQIELPRSVAFVPKRKPMVQCDVGSGENNIGKDCEGKRGAIAVDTIEDITVSAVKEDELETTSNAIRGTDVQRPKRQYRTKVMENPEECSR